MQFNFQFERKEDRRSSEIKSKEWKTFELTRKLEKFEEIKKEEKKKKKVRDRNLKY